MASKVHLIRSSYLMCTSYFWKFAAVVGGCSCQLAFQKELLQFLGMQLIEHCTFWKSKQKYVSNLSFGVGHWRKSELIHRCVCLVCENVSILSKFLGRLKPCAPASPLLLGLPLKIILENNELSDVMNSILKKNSFNLRDSINVGCHHFVWKCESI